MTVQELKQTVKDAFVSAGLVSPTCEFYDPNYAISDDRCYYAYGYDLVCGTKHTPLLFFLSNGFQNVTSEYVTTRTISPAEVVKFFFTADTPATQTPEYNAPRFIMLYRTDIIPSTIGQYAQQHDSTYPVPYSDTVNPLFDHVVPVDTYDNYYGYTGFEFGAEVFKLYFGAYQNIAKDVFFDDAHTITANLICAVNLSQPYGPTPDPPTPDPPTPSDDNRLELWRGFKKRINSTKKPTNGEILTVLLKHDTSVLNPSFILDAQYFDYNYCYWKGRYYYIDDVISLNNNQIEIQCSVDVMSTYKSDILSTRCYIERASGTSRYFKPDDLNPPTNTTRIKVTDNILDMGSDNENYVLTFVGKSGVVSYLLNTASMTVLCNDIFDTRLSDEKQSKLMECLLSLTKVPYNVSGAPVPLSDVGDLPTTATGIKLMVDNPLPIDGSLKTINFPSDDFWGNGSNYCDYEPYSTGLLYLPYVGVVPLDLDHFATGRKIRVDAWVDKITADIVYYIQDSGGNILATYDGNCGLSIPISAKSWNARNFKGSVATTIGGGVATLAGAGILAASAVVPGAQAAAPLGGKMLMGGVAGLTGGAMSMYKSAEMHTQTSGNISSNLGYWIGHVVKAFVITKEPVFLNLDNPKTTLGLPFGECETISVLGTGFIKCMGAQVSMAGTDQEKSAVNGFLNSGFYVE